MKITDKHLTHWFTYHGPDADQQKRYQALNEAAKAFAEGAMTVLSKVVYNDQVWFSVEDSSSMFGDGKGPVCMTVGEDNLDPRIHYLAGMYIRFGDLPPDGQSKNHRTSELEEGVSVYAVASVDDEYLPVLPNREALGTYNGGMIDRQAYIVTGRVVGTGSDGEPLLADVVERETYKARKYTITPLEAVPPPGPRDSQSGPG